ncbi:MAG: hypothetical protein E6Q83_03760 [Thiothrix sp.]|nr:MAG: hypothetical protein E6Q83_03760 [Thiothrix sp.]
MKRMEHQLPIKFKSEIELTQINIWKPPSYFLGVRMLGNIAQHETGLFCESSGQYKSDLLLAEKLGFKDGIVHGWKFKIYNNNFCVTLDYWGQCPTTFHQAFDDAIVIFKELDLLC